MGDSLVVLYGEETPAFNLALSKHNNTCVQFTSYITGVCVRFTFGDERRPKLMLHEDCYTIRPERGARQSKIPVTSSLLDQFLLGLISFFPLFFCRHT